MSQCDARALLAEGNCFACLPPEQLSIIRTTLLCQILKQVNPMANCDVQTLLSASNCFACVPLNQLALIQTELLCEILNVGGTGQNGCIVCADVNPTAPPKAGCDCALYYNRLNSGLWYWSVTDLTWYALIGP